VNYLAEARDHLDKALDSQALQGKRSIIKFEADHRRETRDKKTALNNARAKEKEEMAKKKQAEEAEKLKNMKPKDGKKVQYRSKKPKFKAEVTRKVILDEETQDQ
jgi:hypothetical protein